MSAVRFQIRHLQQTLADHVEAHLVALGWTADPPPWGIAPLRFVEVQPNEVADLSPTIVSTLVETEASKKLEQLGGGMYSTEYQVFFDVYAEKLSIALSIASDIRDAIDESVIPLVDYSGANPVEVAGATIECNNSETAPGKGGGATTMPDVKKAWRTVSTFAELTYSET